MLQIIFFSSLVFSVHTIYQSAIHLSSHGFEFQPQHNVQLMQESMTQNRLLCSVACNQQRFCRTFDYDSTSTRCRVFEADTATGSIVPCNSSTSIVGTVILSSLLFATMHNQSCETCQESRYEICSPSSSTCQCPSHTFWNGSVCLLQLFVNASCSQTNDCRTDLNLTCAIINNNTVKQCTWTNITNRKLTRLI